MLTIRLSRVGRKNDPSFRVIVVDSKRKPKTGNYLELLGSYNARGHEVKLNAERIKRWIKEGATLSDTVHNLLITEKIIEGKKINVLPRKSPPQKAEASAPEVAPEASAPAPEVQPVSNEVAEETPAQ